MSGDFSESDYHFEIILKQRPYYDVALRSWSVFLNQRKQIELLAKNLKIFILNNPKNIWSAVELAQLFWGVGDKEAAIEQMNMTTIETKSDTARFYLAYLFDLNRNHPKARKLLAETIDSSLDIDFHIGLSFYKENKLTEALKHWLKVSAESTLYFKAQVNAALVYEKINNFEKAKEILNSLTPPLEFKKSVEQKIVFLSDKKVRTPAQTKPSELSYFINWSLPQL